MARKKIAVLGTGEVGKTLTKGFAELGHEVKQVGRTGFAEAAKWADTVVLAVKGSAAEKAVTMTGADNLAGKTVLDTTNPLADAPPDNGVLKFFTSLDGSLMERLQKAAPRASFVKCFSSVGSASMVKPDFGGQRPTMFICGDSDAAKAETRGILEAFGWDAEDMGGVQAARAIEPLCILWCIPGFRTNSWTHAFKLLKK
jgi:predicted dinucleotide-binding enzyme